MACACVGGGQWPGHTLVMEHCQWQLIRVTAGADVDAKTNEGQGRAPNAVAACPGRFMR